MWLSRGSEETSMIKKGDRGSQYFQTFESQIAGSYRFKGEEMELLLLMGGSDFHGQGLIPAIESMFSTVS